jgi:hypothetical protein
MYIVNNMYNNHIIYNEDEDTLTADTLTSLQYFNIMSFLDEIA